ncbi:MAG: hypothetical protein ACRYGF_06090 [Janthinobacterium lividum]
MALQRRSLEHLGLSVAAALLAANLPAQTSMAAAMAARVRTSTSQPQPAGAIGESTPPATLEEALHALFAAADVVFAGEVIAIEHGAGAVTVHWRVEHAVRGTDAGAVYDLREWPGLWVQNEARYVVSERALVLLHAPSAAGYASPLPDGIIPMRGDTANAVLDLGLIAQHVVATDAARLRPMRALQKAGGSLALASALQAQDVVVADGSAGASRLLPSQGGGSSSALVLGVQAPSADTTLPAGNGNVDGTMVLGMLNAWQRNQDAPK